jgi:hypothetical protein
MQHVFSMGIIESRGNLLDDAQNFIGIKRANPQQVID